MTPQGRQWPHSAAFNANFEQISCLVLVFEQENAAGFIIANRAFFFFFLDDTFYVMSENSGQVFCIYSNGLLFPFRKYFQI